MMVKYEAFAKHAPYMEKLSIDQNRLKDNKRNRIAEVMLKEGDERADCVYVGCAYSLPELYIMNNEIRSIKEVTLEFADTNMLSDTSIFHITSPFSLALPLFSVAAYSDEI
jgi:hypothetical protein